MTEAIRMRYWRGAKGFVPENFIRLKELSTCDKCRQAANLYVLIPVLQMWVCEKCEKRLHYWGLTKLKHLLRFYEREKICH